MLFNVKTVGLESELMNDEQLDRMIKKFSSQVGTMDDLVDGLREEVEAYIGNQRLQDKLSFEYQLEKLKKDLNTDVANAMLEFKEIKNTADVLHLGVFYRDISSMPLFNITINKSETEKKQILVNTFPWGFNEYLYFAKNNKNQYLYSNLRKQINQFLSELKKSELSRLFSF